MTSPARMTPPRSAVSSFVRLLRRRSNTRVRSVRGLGIAMRVCSPRSTFTIAFFGDDRFSDAPLCVDLSRPVSRTFSACASTDSLPVGCRGTVDRDSKLPNYSCPSFVPGGPRHRRGARGRRVERLMANKRREVAAHQCLNWRADGARFIQPSTALLVVKKRNTEELLDLNFSRWSTYRVRGGSCFAAQKSDPFVMVCASSSRDSGVEHPVIWPDCARYFL